MSKSNIYKLSLTTLIGTEEGHLLIENVVNIFFTVSAAETQCLCPLVERVRVRRLF
jgi:hypothetical protein